MEIVNGSEVDTCKDDFIEDLDVNVSTAKSVPTIPMQVGNVPSTDSSGTMPSIPVRSKNQNHPNPNFQPSIVSPRLQRISKKGKVNVLTLFLKCKSCINNKK